MITVRRWAGIQDLDPLAGIICQNQVIAADGSGFLDPGPPTVIAWVIQMITARGSEFLGILSLAMIDFVTKSHIQGEGRVKA